LSRLIGERRLLGVPCARMAQRAIIQLPVSRKSSGVENMLSFFLCRMSRLISDVLISLAVTFCAPNAKFIIARISRLSACHFELKGRAVTFQAAGLNDPFKIDLAVHIARAVDPFIDSSQVGDGQLE